MLFKSFLELKYSKLKTIEQTGLKKQLPSKTRFHAVNM